MARGDAPSTPGPTPITVLAPAAATPDRRSARPSIIGWVVAIAAAVVLSVTATTLIVGGRVDDRLEAQDQAIEDLLNDEGDRPHE